MAERELTISNKLGLHARASAKLVQLASRYKAAVFISARGREVNAKSIMGLMLLAAPKGTPIKLRTDGEDADAALAAAVDLFERKFDEGE
ncbi:phosphocarrier protein HPr [Ahniella affigens]|uniref:Phosphocarrier protein HPr n=1 Tax=Ahniella affigens TaxID=2021234 RepID=A0A2P1PYP3_9GAMM|nr:HPr family phosphocarrier protein [Ahniella affigens]AVP99961.1 phosphocarrier protein HPr [Ahniella affigens]